MSMHPELTTDLSFENETSSSTAYTHAITVLWLDIFVTCAILAVVASQL